MRFVEQPSGPGESLRECEACGRPSQSWVIGATCILLRCPSCGHVERDIDRCRAGARSHAWGGRASLDWVRLALTSRRLHQLLPKGRRARILEIGMGQGLILAHFLKRGHEVSGIDPGSLERDIAHSLRSNATLYTQPAEEVELPERSFDLIYAIHVVEHLRDPALVLRSCFRALRPDGALYLMTPNALSDGLRFFGERWWNLEDPTHVRFFSPKSISTMLSRSGFERARIHTPLWDSLSIEISSLFRTVRPGVGQHGVLGNGAILPLYVLVAPLALAARIAWRPLSPSMEVTARKRP
jgi:SAM-dependent methyltransferase